MSKDSDQKVFCLGFMKIGTTTLNKALNMLGYKVSHNSWRWLKDIQANNWQLIKQKASSWDALEDNPIPFGYKELDELFPNSKFILTHRDTDKWYNSVSYHIVDLPSPMHEWVFGKGKCLPKQDEHHTKKIYESHLNAVRAYFSDRPHQLLEIDITQTRDWTELCNFLEKPVPIESFPHANKTNYNHNKHSGFKRKLKYWKKSMLNPIKIQLEHLSNAFPSPQERFNSLEHTESLITNK